MFGVEGYRISILLSRPIYGVFASLSHGSTACPVLYLSVHRTRATVDTLPFSFPTL